MCVQTEVGEAEVEAVAEEAPMYIYQDIGQSPAAAWH